VEPIELLYAWGRQNADALDQLGDRPTSRRQGSGPARAGETTDKQAATSLPSGCGVGDLSET
jgi:hypothetical protein